MLQTKIYTRKKSNGLANGMKSENLESDGVSVETIAATRIQTAFRAYKVCQFESFREETDQVQANFIDSSTSLTNVFLFQCFIIQLWMSVCYCLTCIPFMILFKLTVTCMHVLFIIVQTFCNVFC